MVHTGNPLSALLLEQNVLSTFSVYGTHSTAIIKFIQNNGLEVKLKTVDKNRKIELNQEMRLYHHDDLFVLNYTFLFQPLLFLFVCSFKVIFIFHPYIHNVVQILKEINTTYYFVCVTRRFKQTYFMEGGSFKHRKITRILTKRSNTPICKVYHKQCFNLLVNKSNTEIPYQFIYYSNC